MLLRYGWGLYLPPILTLSFCPIGAMGVRSDVWFTVDITRVLSADAALAAGISGDFLCFVFARAGEDDLQGGFVKIMVSYSMLVTRP